MRFYSETKAPDLRVFLYITLAWFAGAVFVIAMNHSTAYQWVSFISAVYFFMMSIIMFIFYVRQMRYKPYSYEAIYYAGFGIFMAMQALIHSITLRGSLLYPENYNILSFLSSIRTSAENFMYLSFPAVVLFSAALCVTNVKLLKKEGFSLSNILGILLSVIMVSVTVLLFLYDMYASGSVWDILVHDLVIGTVSGIYLYFECMIIGAMIVMGTCVRCKPDYNADYIIILGCGIRPDGTPYPLLQGRIDKALEFRNAQIAEGGKHPVFITSGGQGDDEVISEAQSMADYLKSKGVPEEEIIQEDQSFNTLQNMENSKKKLPEPEDVRVIYSTTNYHVFRSGYFAEKAGMKAIGIGAKTKWYFWPNAAVREFVGLLTKQKVRQAIILSLILIGYAALTYYSIMIYY